VVVAAAGAQFPQLRQQQQNVRGIHAAVVLVGRIQQEEQEEQQ
jgi:hypothetical protein